MGLPDCSGGWLMSRSYLVGVKSALAELSKYWAAPPETRRPSLARARFSAAPPWYA
ncbi:hypothetical protein MFM001_24260 [Mycobacterium sp. MFM001]|nr:hypothetical protein MFM001_24260 [Mycobacterium sp. MFM001]